MGGSRLDLNGGQKEGVAAWRVVIQYSSTLMSQLCN